MSLLVKKCFLQPRFTLDSRTLIDEVGALSSDWYPLECVLKPHCRAQTKFFLFFCVLISLLLYNCMVCHLRLLESTFSALFLPDYHNLLNFAVIAHNDLVICNFYHYIYSLKAFYSGHIVITNDYCSTYCFLLIKPPVCCIIVYECDKFQQHDMPFTNLNILKGFLMSRDQ